MINNDIIEAKKAFYNHKYLTASELFLKNNYTYEAGLSYLLSSDFINSRKCFEIKKEICEASTFGLIILDILENKELEFIPKYFQIRAFLEIFLNLMIENKLFEMAQKILETYELFTKSNIETPKFIARVLSANEYYSSVHSFADTAKEICFYDAEIHYIDAELYRKEGKIEDAKKCIEDCLTFAPEYYPILKLKKEIEDAV